jgi:hypothetical protein
MEVLPREDHTNDGTPVVVTGRQMVYAAVNGFHSQTLAYEWDAPGLLPVSAAAWWRVPGEDGIVPHCLSWAPLLLDYGSIAAHDTSTLDQWTLDGDYLFNNSGNIKRMHVVQDSDEIFLASWGPLAEGPLTKTRFPFEGRLAGHFFRQSFYGGFFDPLKRKLFFLPVRWHSKPLNDKWTAVEQRAMRILLDWVKPPDDAATPIRPVSAPQRVLATIANLPLSVLHSSAYAWMFRHRIRYHFGRIMRGEWDSISRITWFVRSFMLGSGASDPPRPHADDA